MTIAEAIAAAQFPVYGIVGHPLGLTRSGLFTSTGYTPSLALTSLALDYTSPHYPSYSSEMLVLPTFRVISARSRIVSLDEPDCLIDLLLQEQAQPVRNPFLWAYHYPQLWIAS